jgi:hypothetical protein
MPILPIDEAHEALRRQTKNFITEDAPVPWRIWKSMGKAGNTEHVHITKPKYTGYANIGTPEAHCHGISPAAGGPPDSASNAIREYSDMPSKGYSDTGMPNPGDHIYDVPKMIDDKINEAVAHLVAELDGMAQRCEELEIELECLKNAFPEHEDEILPKHRGKFNDY